MKLKGKVEVEILADDKLCGDRNKRCIFERFSFFEGYVCYVFGEKLIEEGPETEERLPSHLRCDKCREAFRSEA